MHFSAVAERQELISLQAGDDTPRVPAESVFWVWPFDPVASELLDTGRAATPAVVDSCHQGAGTPGRWSHSSYLSHIGPACQCQIKLLDASPSDFGRPQIISEKSASRCEKHQSGGRAQAISYVLKPMIQMGITSTAFQLLIMF